MKAIRIFNRNIASAFKSIFRNFSLSVASIVCTTITLVIVSLAIIFSANVNNFTKELENTLTIIVFADRGATKEEEDNIENKIKEIKNVKKDEVLKKDKETLREEIIKNEEKKTEKTSLYTIMNSLNEDTNFLKTEFIVHVKDVEDLKETAETIRTIDKVSEVKYEESVVKKMVPVFNVVSKVTVVIIIGLICVTVFLICNTIKLTIFARRNEIEIMRLVGTSNFVIKLPFVIEGLFLGIIGSIIPVAATIWGYTIAYDKMNGHLFTNFITMLKPLPFTVKISGILVLIGAVVGMFGSYRTVRRYLKI